MAIQNDTMTEAGRSYLSSVLEITAKKNVTCKKLRDMTPHVVTQMFNHIITQLAKDPGFNHLLEEAPSGYMVPNIAHDDELLSLVLWDMQHLPSRRVDIQETNSMYLKCKRDKMLANYMGSSKLSPFATFQHQFKVLVE